MNCSALQTNICCQPYTTVYVLLEAFPSVISSKLNFFLSSIQKSEKQTQTFKKKIIFCLTPAECTKHLGGPVVPDEYIMKSGWLNGRGSKVKGGVVPSLSCPSPRKPSKNMLKKEILVMSGIYSICWACSYQ